MHIGDRGRRPDGVGCHLERVLHGRCGLEAEATNRTGVAADDDDLAQPLEGVAAPVPHVERMHAVVGVAVAVQVDVPLVLGEVLLVLLLVV